MSQIFLSPCGTIVKNQYAMPIIQEPRRQMTANKTGSACDKRVFHEIRTPIYAFEN